MKKNALCSWSGGKDSCYALMQAIEQGYTPQILLNVLNEAGKISRSHGIPEEILKMQANAAQLKLHTISSSWQEYETKFTASLQQLKQKYDLSYAVFGDIDLQAHRDWEEKVCANAGLTAILPLWQKERKQLVLNMFDADIEAIIVSCNGIMGSNYIGRTLTPALTQELEAIGVDPCGENGEYHTLVLDCPLFSERINVAIMDKVQHNDYWFAQMEPA